MRKAEKLNALSSAGETFKKTAWNILVGTAIIAGGIWSLFHVAPGIVGGIHAQNIAAAA